MTLTPAKRGGTSKTVVLYVIVEAEALVIPEMETVKVLSET